MTERRSSLIFLITALALVPLMPSGDSIWVDEAQTWRYARHDSLAEVRAEFRAEKFSEAQMPLGMAAAWGWAQLLGTSEWALRAPNMVYAVGAILCFYLIGRRERLPLMPLFLAFQPFLWFYMNEARPYALQIFGGSLLLLALHQVYRGSISSIRWVLVWGAGALVCSAGSMLGAIPSLTFSGAILCELVRRSYRPARRQLAVFAGTTLLLFGLGGYYLQTLLAGAGGSKIWSIGLQNVLFSIIEFVGFAGLLPSRQELRAMARAGLSYSGEFLNLWTFALPTLVMAILLVVLGLFWLRHFRQTPRWITACLLVTAGSAALLFTASLVVGFPFWGRHLAPAFPAFIAAFGWLVASAWRSSRLLAKASAAGLVVLLLISSLMLRSSDRHAKDDYRTAATAAKQVVDADGIVWWAADSSAALYYGLQTGLFPDTSGGPAIEPGAFMANNRTVAYLDRLPKPDLIILSKLDIYDRYGFLRQWMQRNDYTFSVRKTAFDFFTPSGDLAR